MTGRVAKLGGRAGASEGDPTSSMCEPCREAYPKLVDAIRPCDRVGCEHVWTWPVAEQIEAFAANRPAPQRLCLDCEARLSSLADREIPCSVTGCNRHAVFTRRAQLIAGGSEGEPAPAPTMMCAPCANVYEKIKDRQITCGIQGCKQKWSWTRDAQIQDYAAGLPNEPPRRLCDACRTVFGAIADREVRCRTSGCKNTWTWPRETQLSAAVAGKPLPKAPHRMCQRCIDVYSATRDIERPCRRPGCKRTWTDKRGAQLARAVRGKTGDPYPHYCTECEKELGEMEDRQVPCKTEHCPGTWTWTAAQQLAAGVRPEVKVAPGASSSAGAGAALEGAAHGEDAHGGGRHPDHAGHHSAHHPAPLGPQVGGGASLANVAKVDGPDGPNEDAQGEAPDAGHQHAHADGHHDGHDDAGHDDAGHDDAGHDDAGHDDGHDDAHDAVLAEGSSPVEPASGQDPRPGAGPDGHDGHQRVGAVASAGTGKKRRRRKRRKEIRPPERRCEDCVTFLKDRKTREIPCVGCKTTIFWPPESQLQTHLGNWAEPTLCGACKRDLTEAARAIEREALRHGGVHAHLPEAPHGSPAAVAAGGLEHGPPDLVETAPPEGAPPVLTAAAIPSETILN